MVEACLLRLLHRLEGEKAGKVAVGPLVSALGTVLRDHHCWCVGVLGCSTGMGEMAEGTGMNVAEATVIVVEEEVYDTAGEEETGIVIR